MDPELIEALESAKVKAEAADSQARLANKRLQELNHLEGMLKTRNDTNVTIMPTSHLIKVNGHGYKVGDKGIELFRSMVADFLIDYLTPAV